MPNAKGGSPFVKFAKHFYQDPTTGKYVGFACPAKSRLAGFQQYACPTCEASARMRKSRIKADRDFGYKMKAKWRALINVYVRPNDAVVQAAMDDGVDPPKGQMKLWEISSWVGEKNGKNMHERLLALRNNPRVGGNYVDPSAAGFDLLIQRQGENINTRYEVHALLSERKPLLPDPAAAQALIEDGQLDIAWYIAPPTLEELSQILQGEKRGGKSQAVATGASSNPQLPAGGGETAGEVIDVEDVGGDTGAGF